jgi:hypothetical protein
MQNFLKIKPQGPQGYAKESFSWRFFCGRSGLKQLLFCNQNSDFNRRHPNPLKIQTARDARVAPRIFSLRYPCDPCG